MPIHNSEIAEIFEELADLLEIEGANQFRVRAYRNAARTVSSSAKNMAEIAATAGALSELPGIGKDLAGKITEICNTGNLALLEECRGRAAPGIRGLLKIPGLGAKRAAVLCGKLKITGLEDLKQAAAGGRLAEIPGFGPKMTQKIIAEAENLAGRPARTRLIVAEEIAGSFLDWLKGVHGVHQIAVAGSCRRKMETVGDIDILVTCDDSEAVIERFVAFDEVKEILSRGPTKSSVRLRSGIQADLRAVAEESFGAALHYFTGSKPHNIAIRAMGVKRGLKVNEYGVFKGNRQIAGQTEEEIYALFDLPYIEPELREMRGEIEAAREHRLPRLVELKDIRGDLHCHSTDSDGHCSLKELADAARQRGYEYLAITDHSKRVAMIQGLDERRLQRQIREIDKLNEKLKGIRLLKSCEVDILEDGSLDFADEVLAELDLVVCSVHSMFNLPADKQTERIIRAMDRPHFHILGHPTGRLIQRREPYPLDIERVLRAAKERGCIVELNAQPERLDLSDIHCKAAKELGLKIAISTDTHHESDLNFMRQGVCQARRGWLEAGDVVNTRSWTDLKKLLRRT